MHGGGCVLGDIGTHDIFCRALCHDTGATVFSLDYRLAPEHPFPAAVEDTVAALQWLSREAEAMGLDASRIAVAGDSAGGGLAAVALHETKGELAAPVRAQALIYPALDLRGRLPSRKVLAEQFPIPREMIGWFFDRYFGLAWPFTDPRAIPSLYEDYSGLPPALIVTAGHDPLRDEGQEYAMRLADAGVPVEYDCREGTIHGFMNMGRVLRGRAWLGPRTASRHGSAARLHELSIYPPIRLRFERTASASMTRKRRDFEVSRHACAGVCAAGDLASQRLRRLPSAGRQRRHDRGFARHPLLRAHFPSCATDLHLVATVYNTLGLNDCPAFGVGRHHRGGHEAALRRAHRHPQRPALFHHGLRSRPAAPPKRARPSRAGGLEFTERASIDVGLMDLMHRPYRELTIDRDTIYRFKAGNPVFMLEAPDGSRYAMQAYAQIVDKSLAYAGLPALGNRLKLPSGWRYTTLTPETDLVLGAKGTATVVQDELENTYQKLD